MACLRGVSVMGMEFLVLVVGSRFRVVKAVLFYIYKVLQNGNDDNCRKVVEKCLYCHIIFLS